MTVPQWAYGLPWWIVKMNDSHEVHIGRDTGFEYVKATCSIAKGIQAGYVKVDLKKREVVPNELRPIMHHRNANRLIEVWIEEKPTGTHEGRW